jgi:hypothetical protein
VAGGAARDGVEAASGPVELFAKIGGVRDVGDGAVGTELPELAFDGVGGGRGEPLPLPLPTLTLGSLSLLAELPERDLPPSLESSFDAPDFDSTVSDRFLDGSPVGVVSPDFGFLFSSAILRWCSSWSRSDSRIASMIINYRQPAP